MNPRILIVYATRMGSTAGIVETMQHELMAYNFDVEVKRAEAVTDVKGYDGIIVGSSIRIGSWLPEAIRFLQDFRYELRTVPVAFFTVCMTMAKDTPESREEVMGYLEKPRQLVEPISIGLFAGAVDMQKFNFTLKMLVRVSDLPQGDFRDWAAIRRWTRALATKFSQPTITHDEIDT